MPKKGKVELKGLVIVGVSTKRKFGQDSKVEILSRFTVESLGLGPDELKELHELEGDDVNVTIARVQTRADED